MDGQRDTVEVGIEQARKRLGDLVAEAQNGTEVLLTRHGRPAAKVVPMHQLPNPTLLETLATYRRFGTVPDVVDTLGIGDRSPGLVELGKAEIAYEAAPFAKLIADIDAFFGDQLTEALTGPDAATAENEVRRIFGEHLSAAIIRLSLSAAAASQIDWVNSGVDILRTIAGVALQRAADLRFTRTLQETFSSRPAEPCRATP